jgi:hypothetical protein
MLLLPGCEPGDHVTFSVAADDDFTCPLTQEPPKDFAIVPFLADLHAVNAGVTAARKRRRDDEDLHEQIQALPPTRDVCRLDACGHTFLSVPLLYHVMTTGFKCPICRCGSESSLDLAAAAPPGVLDPVIWACLTQLARMTRERHRVDEAAEELTLLAQMQNAEISAINTMSVEELIEQIQITILFNIYRQGPSGSSMLMPSARVAVNLRPNILRSLTSVAEHSEDDTPLIYESGQAQRPLSILLRTAARFSITLFAQTSEGGVPFFQSPIIATSESMRASSPHVISCAPPANSEVRLYWEHDPAGRQRMLRRIDYQSTSTGIRALSLQALNGLAG